MSGLGPRRAAAAALALLLALPGAAQAPPVELGEVGLEELLDLDVEAVTRREERASGAPAWVFVLTREDLRQHGFRTLHEALAALPGLFGYADGLYPMAGVRGIGLLSDYSTRLLVLLDGHPLNNSLGIGESYLGRDLPVPLGAVSRIEVIEGPVGGVYGPTAFLGVVNVVTERPASSRRVEALGAIEGRQERLAAGEAELLATGAAGPARASVALGGSGGRGQSWRFPELALDADRAVPEDLRVRGADDAAALSGYARLALGRLEAAAACARDRRTLPSAPYGALVGDPRTELVNRTCFAELTLRTTPRPGFSLEARAAYDDFLFEDAYGYEPAPEGTGIIRDRGVDRWLSAELRGGWQARPGTWLSAGIAGQVHHTSQEVTDLRPIHKDFRTVNVALAADQAVGPAVRLHGGLTFHANELFGARLTPRVAAVLSPGKADTLKLLYSEGFRAPTAAEAFFEDGTDFLASPDLRPEVARSAEVIWEHRAGAWATASLSAFRTVYLDLVEFVTVPAPGLPGPPDPADPSQLRQQARNAGTLHTLGAVAALRLRLGGRLSGWAGISAQRADGERLANFPAATASAALAWRTPWPRLTLAVSGVALAARRKDLSALLPGERSEVPAAASFGASAILDVARVPGLSVELAVRNLGAGSLVHPVTGDFTPVSEQPEPAPAVRLALRYAP